MGVPHEGTRENTRSLYSSRAEIPLPLLTSSLSLSSTSLSSSLSSSSSWMLMPLTSLMYSRKPKVFIYSPELRYPCHRCCPCCCRRPCRCPPPRRCPPHRRHHHEADALDVLDVLAKTPCLYQVPELRYWVKYLVEKKRNARTDAQTTSFL